MISKLISGPEAAIDVLTDGMTLMLGGFGLCGIPEQLIVGLLSQK
jgi:3-oxoacid CoA-transferase subunit A